ncbi:hypothetical protein OIU76_011226 [Salix suchowensis]|nr:hypothetical protein OIU76_011226 [Salix suchowensis]
MKTAKIITTKTNRTNRQYVPHEMNGQIKALKRWHWLHLQSLAKDQHTPFQLDQ